MANSDEGCEVIIPGTITPKRLPSQDGGGHEFVTELPATGIYGIEYIVMSDPTDPSTFVGTYVWDNDSNSFILTSSGGGGGGDATAKYNYTTNIAVGGVPVGTSVHSTDLLADLVKQMLVTVYYPTYVAPSASLTYSPSTLQEVGASISAATATVGYNAGAINLQGVKQNNRGGAATKYYVSTSGADTEYSADSTSSGSFNVPVLTRSTKGNIVVTGKVDYAQGPQPKDSNGNDYQSPLPAGSVTATKTIEFIQAFFYGKTAGTSISDFTGLTKDISKKGQKKYKFTTNNEHMVIAYDASYGNLSSILDPNSFEVISGWTKSSLTVGGFNYNVYIADSATTDTNAEFTFKF